MAKLTRVPLKPFAGTAALAEVSQFGSVVEGAKLHTLDIATIQALDSWLAGFSKALITGNRYPSMQEMNGVLKVLSYEQAYALQEGIPEYDAATTYYIGSIVKKTGTFELYGSLTNDNVGNALVDGANWKLLVDLADVGGGGVVDFENYGEVTTNLTLLENKISTAHFPSTNTITLPTITDTTKQVTCILNFTTATSGQPTITNTNLKWSDKNGGKAPTSYATISGVQNVLIFKSIWISSVLYWEAEYSAYGAAELPFAQPALSADGSLGGSSFAIYVSNYYGSTYGYLGFDNNSNTFWGTALTSGVFCTIYNPIALKVSSISIKNRSDGVFSITGYVIYGSNDNSNWTTLSTGSNSVTSTNAEWSIVVNSTDFYKYYKIYISSSSGSGTGFTQATLNAMYIAI